MGMLDDFQKLIFLIGDPADSRHKPYIMIATDKLYAHPILHSDRNRTVLFVFAREETRLTNVFVSGVRWS